MQKLQLRHVQAWGLYKVQQYVTPQWQLVTPWAWEGAIPYFPAPSASDYKKNKKAYKAQVDAVLEVQFITTLSTRSSSSSHCGLSDCAPTGAAKGVCAAGLAAHWLLHASCARSAPSSCTHVLCCHSTPASPHLYRKCLAWPNAWRSVSQERSAPAPATRCTVLHCTLSLFAGHRWAHREEEAVCRVLQQQGSLLRHWRVCKDRGAQSDHHRHRGGYSAHQLGRRGRWHRRLAVQTLLRCGEKSHSIATAR